MCSAVCVCVSVFTHPLLYSYLIRDSGEWLTLLSKKQETHYATHHSETASVLQPITPD